MDSYVKTHFELLREDFLRPLREMVEKEPAYVNVQPSQRWTALHQVRARARTRVLIA